MRSNDIGSCWNPPKPNPPGRCARAFSATKADSATTAGTANTILVQRITSSLWVVRYENERRGREYNAQRAGIRPIQGHFHLALLTPSSRKGIAKLAPGGLARRPLGASVVKHLQRPSGP